MRIVHIFVGKNPGECREYINLSYKKNNYQEIRVTQSLGEAVYVRHELQKQNIYAEIVWVKTEELELLRLKS